MPPDLAVVNISQLVTNSKCSVGQTVDEDSLGIINDGAMIVDNGKITWTGSMQQYRALNLGKPGRLIDATGRLVTPGFVDPHTHLVFGGSREDEFERKLKGESYKQILDSGGGIKRTIMSTRESSVEALFDAAQSRLKQLISCGVTTIEVKTGYGQDLNTEEKILKVAQLLEEHSGIDIIPTFLGLHSTPPEYGSASDYTRYIIRDVLPKIATLSYRPVFSDCFCESGIFDQDLCRSYLKASSTFGFRLKIHADEFGASGGAELAAETGCTSADHLENSTEAGLLSMAERGVVAVLLPATALYSGIKPPDAKRIQKLGCTIALGTDLSPNSWVESPQLVMMLACTQMGLSPAQALSAFTFGASLALARDDTGRLVPGAKADFVIHEVPDYRFLVYRIGGQYVSSVFKSGVQIYRKQQD
ncbi:MAG: imidazolonepropionase [Nitrososphaerota archaeon]|jgi:imidazolonepropionase|nr:imidazolonepropionase [Nitrososphaerota archaeon]